ncbi:hypothetical protein L3Y34_006664 [Caenorhabditis briggsae]|uniref:glucuronosyltransferase n=2 Tax=Caenorhabditis briggsae TaxID=6238 RepID=A0AAE9A4U2_CAEBR|nr:hypothetical protein L3Y34_006664 [Caenorhabditis briggsae]
MISLQHIFSILFIFPIAVSSLNILVYSPAFAGSHSNFLGKIADTLTEKGHNVTFLVPVVMIGKRDECVNGVKLTKDVVVVEAGPETLSQQSGDINNDENLKAFWKAHMDSSNARSSTTWFNIAMKFACRHFHSQRDVFEQMKAKNFDVAILEPISVCGLGYMKALGIEKTVLASSFTFFDVVLPYTGEELDYSSTPGAFGSFGEKMTMWERYENWMVNKEVNMAQEDMYEGEMEAYRELSGKTLPDWRELLPSASLFFVNSNSFLDFPRQVLQKTIPIGGITMNQKWVKEQKLSEDWEKILEQRPHTILISFGSMIKSMYMPKEWRNGLLETVRSMPNVTFIWKYESDDVAFASGLSNLHFSKWVPQTALLNDPRLSAFVSHGGVGSALELAYSGKPTIMIPIFADQIRNANMLARHQGVIHLNKNDMENFRKTQKAFNDILYEESYTRNARKLADVLATQPYSPKDNVIKYTEFVGKHGPFPAMEPHGRHLNYFQRHFLDIYAVFALFYTTIAVIVAAVVWCIYRKCVKCLKVEKIE